MFLRRKNHVLRFIKSIYSYYSQWFTVVTCERCRCELKTPDMRLWKSEYNSFMKMAQPIFCNQLIVVPLTVFHRMAETIGEPKGELVFLFNTSRCGSTLFTQVCLAVVVVLWTHNNIIDSRSAAFQCSH